MTRNYLNKLRIVKNQSGLGNRRFMRDKSNLTETACAIISIKQMFQCVFALLRFEINDFTILECQCKIVDQTASMIQRFRTRDRAINTKFMRYGKDFFS